MVRKITRWGCGLCSAEYETRKPARRCQAQGAGEVLPKGTVLERVTYDIVTDKYYHFTILSKVFPSLLKGYHARGYASIELSSTEPWEERSMKAPNYLVSENEVYIKVGNTHFFGAMGKGIRFSRLSDSEVTELCKKDKNFSYHFAHVTKDTRGEVK